MTVFSPHYKLIQNDYVKYMITQLNCFKKKCKNKSTPKLDDDDHRS